MNPHSNLASFYRYFYMTENLPNNLCNYFWGLLFAFVCLPFVWTAMLLNRILTPIKLKEYDMGEGEKKKYGYSKPYNPFTTGFGVIFTTMIIVIGMVTLRILLGKTFGHNGDGLNVFGTSPYAIILYLYCVGLLTVLGGVVTFLILMFLWRLLPNKTPETDEEFYAKLTAKSQIEKERIERRRTNPSFLVLTWRWLVAFKEKNCPLITWDYTKKD